MSYSIEETKTNKNMKKKVVKLNEAKLREMISKLIKESMDEYYENGPYTHATDLGDDDALIDAEKDYMWNKYGNRSVVPDAGVEHEDDAYTRLHMDSGELAMQALGAYDEDTPKWGENGRSSKWASPKGDFRTVSESTLRKIVAESVKRALKESINEYEPETYANMSQQYAKKTNGLRGAVNRVMMGKNKFNQMKNLVGKTASYAEDHPSDVWDETNTQCGKDFDTATYTNRRTGEVRDYNSRFNGDAMPFRGKTYCPVLKRDGIFDNGERRDFQAPYNGGQTPGKKYTPAVAVQRESITMNEAQLRKIVSESIRSTLKESSDFSLLSDLATVAEDMHYWGYEEESGILNNYIKNVGNDSALQFNDTVLSAIQRVWNMAKNDLNSGNAYGWDDFDDFVDELSELYQSYCLFFSDEEEY